MLVKWGVAALVLATAVLGLAYRSTAVELAAERAEPAEVVTERITKVAPSA